MAELASELGADACAGAAADAASFAMARAAQSDGASAGVAAQEASAELQGAGAPVDPATTQSVQDSAARVHAALRGAPPPTSAPSEVLSAEDAVPVLTEVLGRLQDCEGLSAQLAAR